MSESGMVETEPTTTDLPSEIPVTDDQEEPDTIDGLSENEEEKDREEVIAAYQSALSERNSKLKTRR